MAKTAGPGSLVRCGFAWYSDGWRFDPAVRQHFFMETGHEVTSTAILSLPLIQVGQLSVTGGRMCTCLNSCLISVCTR